jgi:carboxypeptidase family protein
VTRRAAGCAAVAVAVAAACAIREPRVSGTAAAPCSSSAQCGSDSVCFLGECRGSSSQLSVVSAEVRAPAGEQLGVLQLGGIDLRESPRVDFQLQPLLTANGTVVQMLDAPAGATAPVPDAGVVLSDTAAPIADRATNLTTQTDLSGAFSLPFHRSTWNVLVLPPGPTPPLRAAPLNPPDSGSTADVPIVLPRPAELVHVAGTVTAGPVPLSGAWVSAVDASGQALSVPVTSGAQGEFTLVLPPGPPSFLVQVAPRPDASDTDPPVPAFSPRLLSGATLDLGELPAPVTLLGEVRDERGQPVPSARVVALSTDPAGWVISRQTVTDSDGAFKLSLRAGAYVVEAAPDPDPSLPGVSGEVAVGVALGSSPIILTCLDKAQAVGLVLRPDGQHAGAGYQITATRLPDRVITGRLASTTPTDANGAFAIVGDIGRYRLEILPPTQTELPRKIVTVDLSAGQGGFLPPLRLSRASKVVGTVTRPGAVPVFKATVDFFALDASGHRSVLIGSVVSDQAGVYTAVLPDVAAPVTLGP